MAREPKFTDVERLILINQLNIRKAIEKGDGKHYDEMIEILEKGYEVFYGEMTGHLYEPLSDARARLVFDVLDLYSAVEHYKTEHPEDTEVVKHPGAKFAGFDGNHEGDYLGFAAFLMKQGKYTEHAKRKPNSHAPMLPTYEKRIATWHAMSKPFPLDRLQVRALIGVDES